MIPQIFIPMPHMELTLQELLEEVGQEHPIEEWLLNLNFYLLLFWWMWQLCLMRGNGWMYQKAQADGKRLVINMSWGLYHFGTLDGTSLLSQAITSYTDLGVVFANSAGNNGNVNFHIKKQFNNDLLKSKIDFLQYFKLFIS